MDSIDYLDMFEQLPSVTHSMKPVNDWGYAPNLYFFEGEWRIDWISCSEGDCLFGVGAKTTKEVIQKAYDLIKDKGLLGASKRKVQ